MDIFVIKIVDADNVHMDLLREFQKKEIQDEKKWNEHCFSYLMTDRILREFYKIDDRKIVFKNSKPYLLNNAKYFNISRKDEYVVIAFSDNECAISLEKIKDKNIEFYNDLTIKNAKIKLKKASKAEKNYQFSDYVIGVVSSIDENFEIYIQSGEVIPK